MLFDASALDNITRTFNRVQKWAVVSYFLVFPLFHDPQLDEDHIEVLIIASISKNYVLCWMAFKRGKLIHVIEVIIGRI